MWTWITSHPAEVTAIVLGLLRIIETIVTVTKNKIDDKVLGFVKEFFKLG